MSLRRTRCSILLAGLLALIVAGCAGPTPSASPSAAAVATPVPTAVPTPRPTGTPRPTASPRPTATPIPTLAVDGAVAIARFLAFAETDDIPYHMDVDMEIGVLSQAIRMAMGIDARGADMAGTLRMASGGQRYDVDIIVLDGRQYARVDGATWVEVPDAGAVANPWSSLPMELLTVEGTELIDGVPHHHLRIDDPAVANTADLDSETLTEVVVERGVFDLYVTDDGLPARARTSVVGTAVANGVRTELEVVAVYEFSEIGTPVDIEAPF